MEIFDLVLVLQNAPFQFDNIAADPVDFLDQFGEVDALESAGLLVMGEGSLSVLPPLLGLPVQRLCHHLFESLHVEYHLNVFIDLLVQAI